MLEYLMLVRIGLMAVGVWAVSIHFSFDFWINTVTMPAVVCILWQGVTTPKSNGWSETYRMNMATIQNPLYVRGYLRKSQEDCIFDNFKFGFFCQKALIVMAFLAWMYGKLYYDIPGRSVVRYLIISGLVLLQVMFVASRIFFSWRYIEDFRCFQNKRKNWQPFSFIWQNHGMGRYRPFWGKFHFNYEETKEMVYDACLKMGYAYLQTRDMKTEGEECVTYVKREVDCIYLFQLIHMRIYKEAKMDELNCIFEELWVEYIKEKQEKKSVALTYLLCIDEFNTEIRRKMGSIYAVDQKKGRYRLPAVLIYSETISLIIPVNLGWIRGKKQYNKMRRELLKMLGLSEKQNVHKL